MFLEDHAGMLELILANTQHIIKQQGVIMAAIDDLKAAAASNATAAAAALAAATQTITDSIADSIAANGGSVSAADAETVVGQLNTVTASLNAAATQFASEDPAKATTTASPTASATPAAVAKS